MAAVYAHSHDLRFGELARKDLISTKDSLAIHFAHREEGKFARISFGLICHLTSPGQGGFVRSTETSDRESPLIVTVMPGDNTMRMIQARVQRRALTSDTNARHGVTGRIKVSQGQEQGCSTATQTGY